MLRGEAAASFTRNRQRGECGAAKILIENTASRTQQYVTRAGNRKGCYGQSSGERFEDNQSVSVG
jgi:hypothetical protein